MTKETFWIALSAMPSFSSSARLKAFSKKDTDDSKFPSFTKTAEKKEKKPQCDIALNHHARIKLTALALFISLKNKNEVLKFGNKKSNYIHTVQPKRWLSTATCRQTFPQPQQ